MKLFKFKKTRKTEHADKWYVVAFINDNTRHIIDEGTLQLMLTFGEGNLFALFATGATNNLGWHIGLDNLVYERHTLSEYGKAVLSEVPNYFSEKNMHISKYYRGITPTNMLNALKEINNEISSNKLEREKEIIKFLCKKNLIESITEYTGKELANVKNSVTATQQSEQTL